ncbi:MAG: ribosomal protein S18-alanine N-acetyltransferase [Lachnospiraceae bacterium]
MNRSGIEEDLRYRAAEITDLEIVVRIEQECFSMPWSKIAFAACLDHTHICFILAEYCGEVAGFSVLYSSVEEAELTNIAVRESFRKKGIAEGLMESNLAFVRQRNITNVFLEVRKSNQAAIHLYKKFQFSELGIRKNFYEEPREDAIVMKLEM